MSLPKLITLLEKDLFKFNQIIIWGHKLHSHTHSYIHNAFYIAFKYLKYKVLWLDDNTQDLQNIDFSNSLFITEHQVCKNIPIRMDCKYILHNVFVEPAKISYLNYAGTWVDSRFKKLAEAGNVINMQVYKIEFVQNKSKMEDYVYYDKSIYTLYFPWATDLLPHEITEIQDNFDKIKSSEPKTINFVGTKIKEWKTFRRICIGNGIKFNHLGGYTGFGKLSIKDNIDMVQKSYIAPAIQLEQQCREGYIPCRIFKNISYGKMGITNSETVYNLFKQKIIYNQSLKELLTESLDWRKNKYDKIIILELMDFVKEKHTYLNRIENLFNFFEILN